jgi:hypothetical protein
VRGRCQILIYTFLLAFWALPAAAQVELDGVHMGMAGNVDAGYSGDISNQGGSDHGLSLGGNGFLNGSYYNPSFLSFSVEPYYNRSQANSNGASIFDTGGYSGNVNIFSGGHFPGQINFSQVWDGTGTFGIPGEAGLTTKDNSNGFGIGWSELVPGFPSLSASYAHGSGSSSIVGSDAQTSITTNSFGLHSNYRIAGWALGASFSHTGSDTTANGILGAGDEETHSTETGFGFSAGHNLPEFLHGGFGIGFNRSDYSDNYQGVSSGSSNGTIDNAFANLSFLVWRFPISATANYTDNLYGSFEEYLAANGEPYLQANLSPETRSLIVNVSTVYRIMPHLFATGYVSRSEEYIGGQSYGATQLGATLNFNLGERFKGFTATIGANDQANKYGNTGATLVGNLNYYRSLGHWTLMANYNYNQYVQTMLPMYQTSQMNYSAQLHRDFPRGFTLSIGGGGGRTAFEQVSGDGNMAESASGSVSWRLCRCSLAGNYSYSNGSAVMTPTGLVPVPEPVVTNNLSLFNAQGHGFSFSIAPLRAMSISTSYSKAISNTESLGSTNGLASSNESELISGMLTYRYRKLNFNASVLQFRQGISSSGTLPSNVTSFYFSVSRWLKLF